RDGSGRHALVRYVVQPSPTRRQGRRRWSQSVVVCHRRADLSTAVHPGAPARRLAGPWHSVGRDELCNDDGGRIGTGSFAFLQARVAAVTVLPDGAPATFLLTRPARANVSLHEERPS